MPSDVEVGIRRILGCVRHRTTVLDDTSKVVHKLCQCAINISVKLITFLVLRQDLGILASARRYVVTEDGA